MELLTLEGPVEIQTPERQKVSQTLVGLVSFHCCFLHKSHFTVLNVWESRFYETVISSRSDGLSPPGGGEGLWRT